MVGPLRFATVTILLNDLVSKQHHIAGGHACCATLRKLRGVKTTAACRTAIRLAA